MIDTTISSMIPIGINTLTAENLLTRSDIVTHIIMDEIILINTNEAIGAHKLIPNCILPPRMKI
jgi:hypothetical protein